MNKKTSYPKNKLIAVKFDKFEYQRLMELKERLGLSTSETVRYLIDSAYTQNEDHEWTDDPKNDIPY